MSKKSRTHAQRIDITAESRWAPFVPSDRVSPLLTVVSVPTAEGTEVRVRSFGGRVYDTRVRSLLDTYYPVKSGEEVAPVVHESRPAVDTEPRPGLVRLPVATTVSPIVLNGEGNTVTLDGHAFAVHVFRGRPCVVAGDLGAALGYADGRLAESVRDWREMESPRDFEVLDGDALRAFKALAALTPGLGVSRNAREVMVLSETGMDLACQKAQTEAGARLRRYLADHVLPKLRRGEAPTPIAAPAPAPVLPPASAVEVKLDRMLGAFEQMATLMTAFIQGHALPAPVPPPAPIVLIPVDWSHAGTIAAILSDRLGTKITDARVHRIVREKTDFRGRTDMVRQRSVVSFDEKGQRKEVPQYWHSPAVTEEVYRILSTPGPDAPEGDFRPVDGGKVGDPVSIRDNGRRKK